jgi:LemA protein
MKRDEKTGFQKYKSLIITFAIIAVVLLPGWSSYNGLVQGEESIGAQWANVETVYQRRADLIPNLVSTVKGYASHEQETLTQVVEARAKATGVNVNMDNMNAASMQKFQQMQDGLSGALSKLMVVVEKYPDLKANKNFSELQAQLEGTENRISVERRRYNEETKEYNSRLRKFPTVLYNKLYGFEKKVYFEAQKGTENAPVVEF